MNEWQDLFLGEVGASAALAGLLFVAISINLSRIVGHPGLPDGRRRLLLLGAVLVVSSVELVPQPAIALGIEVALAGLVLWSCIAVIQVRAGRNAEARYSTRSFATRVALGQVSALPVVAGGTLVALGSGAGQYRVAGGLVVSIVAALGTAWMLVEII